MIINSIVELIGDTPLLRIDPSVHGINGVDIFGKLEYMNPFGSIKDRTAMGLLGDYSSTKTIIEVSSGNTAKGLACLANLQGGKVNILTNRIRLKSMKDMMHILGVILEEFPHGGECPDPNDPNSPYQVIEKKLRNNPEEYYYTAQYRNTANPEIHSKTTGKEIRSDLGDIDYFFSGVGTSGSSRGIIETIRGEGSRECASIGIVTEKGSYIPGIRSILELREVGLFDYKIYDQILPIIDQDAIDGMLTLIRKCGMLVGPTTGAVYHGMIEYLRAQDPETLRGKKVVFIACDRVEPYTSYIREKRPEIFETEKKSEKPKTLGELRIIKKEDLQDHKYILIDMRSYPSYELGHIDGSISFPFYKLQEYLKEDYLPFPRESPLVFICPFGEESEIMCQIANGLGYESSSLEGGYQSINGK